MDGIVSVIGYVLMIGTVYLVMAAAVLVPVGILALIIRRIVLSISERRLLALIAARAEERGHDLDTPHEQAGGSIASR
ncbi:MAG: hypothetical protein Q7T71_02105 [Herbiconiux sp.]|nr:hypothetical protein [Herbiconiux sp.]